MAEKQQIHKEMTISDVFANFPQKGQRLAQVMTSAGLHCVGCQASTWETLEVGMLGHGFKEKEIDELIGKLNAILEESTDPTTITMTKRAAEKFCKILKEEKKEGWGLRFSDKPGGCGGFEYVLDFSEKLEETDTLFTSHEVNIYVKTAMLPRLLGCEIDYLEGLNASGFKVTNPNVKGSCSCGNSQSY